MTARYWPTPPDVYARLNAEFNFNFDPCPCPRPPDYNSLVVPWGAVNYVNPPFLHSDAPHGGPSAFARKPLADGPVGRGARNRWRRPAPDELFAGGNQ